MVNVKLLLYVYVVIISSVITSQDAAPYQTWLLSASIESPVCDSKPIAIKELCQTCAKSTKAANVYSMCCENTEDLQIWCRAALDYGIQTRN